MTHTNILLVGNSSNIRNKHLGYKIDSYEKILRFNDYNLSDEYNKDYGSKTNYLCINRAFYRAFINRRKNIETHKYEKIFVIFVDTNELRKTRKCSKKFVFLLQNNIDCLKKEFQLPKDIFLTSGLVMILYFFSKQNKTLHITGFNHTPTHYFENVPDGRGKRHNWEFEKQLISKFEEDGKIIRIE